MIQNIIKRDGRKVNFESEKVTKAIFNAGKAVGSIDYIEAQRLTAKAIDCIQCIRSTAEPTVEQMQDVIEKVLMENGHIRTAKEYILYRADRTRARELKTSLMRTMKDMTFQSSEEHDLKRENANIDADSPMGIMLKYGSETAKHFNELFLLTQAHVAAHRKGLIHIHDMDFLGITTTCTQIDLGKMFQDGFSTGHGYLREPNGIRTAANLACIVLQANQNDQHRLNCA